MKVFFDTMIFLHYRSLDELDLADILGPPPHTIIMPRITLRELDKHKNTHNSSRIRERARRALKKIERWSAGEEVRPGMSMEFVRSLPSVDYQKLGLNPDWGDDVLIASVLQYKAEHPDDGSVSLVTQDSGPRMTASGLGIHVLELPEESKLPVEPDPVEAENRELRQRISALQNALPELTVSFAGSGEPEDHASFVLHAPPVSMDDEIARKIKELKAKVLKEHLQPNQKSPFSAASLVYMTLIPAEEYERYNKSLEKYFSDYERYMKENWEIQAAMRRAIRFQIEIRNIGTSPADDVDVLLHFPDGFRLFSEDDPPKIPREPLPPQKPRTHTQMMMESVNSLSHLHFPRSLPDFKAPSSFKIEQTHSYDVSDHFHRIKHGDRVALPEMYLIFDSYESAHSFTCRYTLRPANLPSEITGDLHFVIEKDDSDGGDGKA